MIPSPNRDPWDDLDDDFGPPGYDQAYTVEQRGMGSSPFSPQSDQNAVTPQQMEQSFAVLPPELQQSLVTALGSDPMASSAFLAVLGPSFGGVINQIMQAAGELGAGPGGAMAGPGGLPPGGGMPPMAGGAGGPPPPLDIPPAGPPGAAPPPPAGGGAASINMPPPGGGGAPPPAPGGSKPPGPPRNQPPRNR